MPKEQLSITIEKDLISELESEVQTGKYRNMSHAIEYFVKKGREVE